MHLGSHPITLAIEISNPTATASGAGVIALAVSRDAVSSIDLEPEGRHDDALMPAIDRLFREAGIEAGDLGRVAVSIGPGGFTSTRIAVTTARMLAMATGAEVCPIPTPLVAAWPHLAGGPVATILATKRDTAWVSVFRRRRAAIGPTSPLAPYEIGSIMDASKLARLLEDESPEAVIADPRTLPDALQRTVGNAGIDLTALRLCARNCLSASAAIDPQPPEQVLPLYPREPEAVTKWRERHPASK